MNEAARIRYRSNGDWSCPLVIRAPFGGGIGGGLYHSQSVEGVCAHVPGLKVVVPSTPYDAKGLLKAAIRDEDPVLFFEHKKSYGLIKGQVPDEDFVVPIGLADIKRDGDDMSVFAYGLMLHYCLDAAAEIGREGVSVEVVDLRTLAPLDRETIVDSVKKTSKALIVYEDNLTMGMGADAGLLHAEQRKNPGGNARFGRILDQSWHKSSGNTLPRNDGHIGESDGNCTANAPTGRKRRRGNGWQVAQGRGRKGRKV